MTLGWNTPEHLDGDGGYRARAPGASALLGSLREELRRLVLNSFTAALRTTQVGGFMLGDVFDMLENLAALRATVSVGRHGAAPS